MLWLGIGARGYEHMLKCFTKVFKCPLILISCAPMFNSIKILVFYFVIVVELTPTSFLPSQQRT